MPMEPIVQYLAALSKAHCAVNPSAKVWTSNQLQGMATKIFNQFLSARTKSQFIDRFTDAAKSVARALMPLYILSAMFVKGGTKTFSTVCAKECKIPVASIRTALNKLHLDLGDPDATPLPPSLPPPAPGANAAAADAATAAAATSTTSPSLPPPSLPSTSAASVAASNDLPPTQQPAPPSTAAAAESPLTATGLKALLDDYIGQRLSSNRSAAALPSPSLQPVPHAYRQALFGPPAAGTGNALVPRNQFQLRHENESDEEFNARQGFSRPQPMMQTQQPMRGMPMAYGASPTYDMQTWAPPPPMAMAPMTQMAAQPAPAMYYTPTQMPMAYGPPVYSHPPHAPPHHAQWPQGAQYPPHGNYHGPHY